MRRVRVHSKSQEKSELDQLCEEYRKFKKSHPLRYARAPEQIKLLTKKAVEGGCSISEIAVAMGVPGPTIRNWLKAAGSEEEPSHNQKDSLSAGLTELRAVYHRMNKVAPAPKERRQNTLKLGMMVRGLLDQGADIETLASTAGVSHITVRTWLKSIQLQPNPNEPDNADQSEDDQAIEVEVEKPSGRAGATAPAIESVPPNQTPTAEFSPNKSEADWIRIRVAGNVMEVNWGDLVQRLSKPEIAQAHQQVSSPVEGEDFNKLATVDSNMQSLIEKYESLIIKHALTRHKTIGSAAEALGMARSTFDAKRKKYGLV